ncbi:MAG: RNA polymerase Rpb4 family protein [Candidatus Geothermarchaeales archaeon]
MRLTMAKKILEEQTTTSGELKAVLDGEDEEFLSQFQRRTLEYLRGFAKFDRDQERVLLDELLKLGDITEEEAVQIVNIIPQTKDELKTVFFHRKTVIMTEFLDNILDVVGKYRVAKEEG